MSPYSEGVPHDELTEVAAKLADAIKPQVKIAAEGMVLEQGVVYLAGLLRPEDKGGHNVDVLNGIAYDAAGDRIFVTGKYWPKLFEIRVKDPTAPSQ